MKNIKSTIILGLKGVAMGAADVVPGVSGGTIAFITGIYQELIDTIEGLNFGLLKLWKKEGFKAFWKASNASFLVTLLAGIFFSVITLAKGISHLLETEPVLVWSFFFGLVLASIFVVAKSVDKFSWKGLIIASAAGFFAYYITTLQPLVNEDASLIFLFISGALAICAMILPGISGSFILVLLGAYTPVLNAIHSRDIKTIAVVGLGAIVGLLSFSRLLKWLFTNYKNSTLTGLIGFIIGSLNKIWPWKQVLTWRTNSHGEQVPLLEKSVLPQNFEGDPQVFYAVLAALSGLGLIILIEWLANKGNKSIEES
ncbi:MAG: DUF368 domain-containing protein [Flavobacteriaceae bacterium]